MGVLVPIAPPEPGLTGPELMARAEALLPELRARAEEIDLARRIPDDLTERLVASGLFRMVQPVHWGGYGCRVAEFAEAMMTIARGSGSVGWVMALTTGHSPKWVSWFPFEGQLECFGDDGDLRFPLIAAPEGTASPVDGGVVLDGEWRYVSGCEVTNWLAVTALALAAPGGPPTGAVSCLIRRSDYEIDDDWHVAGMRGTGSKRAVVHNVFVPSRRVVRMSTTATGEAADPPPAEVRSGYTLAPMLSMFAVELGSVLVGMGLGALDAMVGYLATGKRRSFPPFGLLAEDPAIRLRLGTAAADIDAARALVLGEARAYDERVARGTPWTEPERMTPVSRVQVAAELVGGAVEALCQAAGTTAVRDGSPLARARRDVATARTHLLLQRDPAAMRQADDLLGAG